MTDEAYLRACGWKPRRHGYWMRPTAQESDGYIEPFTLAEAVEAQLAEDRARLAFMLKQTTLRATWPDGRTLTVDLTEATIVAGPKEPGREERAASGGA